MAELNDWQEIDTDNDDWQDVTEQKAPVSPPVEPVSKTESALRGAAQGATFGFADEATAGLESLVSDKSYDELVKETRDLYKAAETQNPATYTAGEFAGGIALPGFGMAQAAKAPTMLAKIAKMAGIGAATGATTGLGYSEAQDLEGTAREVAGGAGVGAIAAPVLGIAAPAVIKGVGKGLAKVSSTIDEAGKMFGYGKKGIDLVGEEAAIREEEALRSAVDQTLKPAITSVNKLENELYESAKKAAGDKTFSLEDLLNLSQDVKTTQSLPESVTAPTERMIKGRAGAKSRGFETIAQEPLDQAEDRTKKAMLDKYSADVEKRRLELTEQIAKEKARPQDANISLLENRDIVESVVKNDLQKGYAKKIAVLETNINNKLANLLESGQPDPEEVAKLQNILQKIQEDTPSFDTMVDPKTGKQVMTVSSRVLNAFGANVEPKPIAGPKQAPRANIADLEAELAKLDKDMPQFTSTADQKTGANLLTLGSDVFGNAVKPVQQQRQLVKQTKEVLEKPSLNVDELSIFRNELNDALKKAGTFEEQMYIQKLFNEVDSKYQQMLDPQLYAKAKTATKNVDEAEALLSGSTSGVGARLAGEKALETKKLASKLTKAQAGDATQDIVDINRAKSALSNVEQMSGTKPQVGEAFDKMRESAEKAYLSKVTTGSAEVMGDPTNPLSTVFISGKGKLLGVSNLAGRAAGWVPQQFDNMAAAIEKRGLPGSKSIANKLRTISSVGDMQKRKAMLFSLEQSPEYRAMIAGEDDE